MKGCKKQVGIGWICNEGHLCSECAYQRRKLREIEDDV